MYHNVQQVKVDSQQQPVQLTRTRMKPAQIREKIRLDGIKSVESTVMTGIVQGPNESVMSWRPHEMTGVETPPQRPGLAIIKRVNAAEAEPGDTLTFTITYRNMGNTPIRCGLDRGQPLAPARVRERLGQRPAGNGLLIRREPRRLVRAAAGSSPG